VVDGVSWRILLDDLDTAYRQLTRGEPVRLGPKTTSFRDWARKLSEHVAAGGLDDELEHWATTLNGRPERPDSEEPTRTVSVSLSAEDTDTLLRAAPAAYRTRINDVLLTALGWALARWTGQERVSVELEGHGREEVLDGVDLTRTVGWFTTIFPVAFDVPADADWRTLVKSVRRQLRAVPGNGFGFGALRYLGTAAARERLSAPGPEVVFNYLGQWDARSSESDGSLYRDTQRALGRETDPAERSVHALEVIGAVQDGRLSFALYHRADLRESAETIAADLTEALRRIAENCRDLVS
jgi:non-ribosomal peptide synthase protein (TIGR01720 family)